MKIVTLNAWGGRRRDALRTWMRESCADIYCLQEVFSAPSMRDARLDDGDGHRVEADLYQQLCRLLPDYHAIFCAGSRGYLNDSTWVPLPIEYGIALFVHASISIVAQRSELVHGPFRWDGAGGPPLSRVAHVARCLTREGALTLGHLHGLWEPAGKQDTPARVAQAQRFRAMLSELAEPEDPVVACGDLNVLPESATFEILGRAGLRNLIGHFGIESTRSALYTRYPRYADYVLVSSGFEVEGLTVVEAPVMSDHCPLVLTGTLTTKRGSGA